MCGYAGFIGFGSNTYECVEPILESMGGTISSRGPDTTGYFICREAEIALVHRRLAIVDLSEAGKQPMASHDGRYILCFNGEIYNHLEIRRSISSVNLTSVPKKWRGHSDTETLVESFSSFGIERTLKLARGMFSLALWDTVSRTLVLARDRAGEKPLYYGTQKGTFFFGSELKAFEVHPDFNKSVNLDAIHDYFKLNYIGGCESIYSGISKLSPGCYVCINFSSSRFGHPVCETISTQSRYWVPGVNDESSLEIQRAQSDAELISRLDELVRNSVDEQLMSDVPIGAFLSGGVDSSLVAALMQRASPRPIKTFSIGFEDVDYNEAGYALDVARHIKSDHYEMIMSPAMACDAAHSLPKIFDEPFADSSQLPMVILSRLARTQVTVALSGDGGDELFGGYSRYVIADRLWNYLAGVPRPARVGMSKILNTLPNSIINTIALDRLGGLFSIRNLSQKLKRAEILFGAADRRRMYQDLISSWTDSEPLLPERRNSARDNNLNIYLDSASNSFLSEMSMIDFFNYLPGDILTKVDRATMFVSLEARVPLLDHRIIDFSWNLPHSAKFRDGQQKWLLRQVLSRYVPDELINRPKKGFAVPLDKWLRGPFREWGEAMILDSVRDCGGFLNTRVIRKKWDEHQSLRRNWSYDLWSVINLQSWLSARSIRL